MKVSGFKGLSDGRTSHVHHDPQKGVMMYTQETQVYRKIFANNLEIFSKGG
jgi:hypothetical protein